MFGMLRWHHQTICQTVNRIFSSSCWKLVMFLQFIHSFHFQMGETNKWTLDWRCKKCSRQKLTCLLFVDQFIIFLQFWCYSTKMDLCLSCLFWFCAGCFYRTMLIYEVIFFKAKFLTKICFNSTKKSLSYKRRCFQCSRKYDPQIKEFWNYKFKCMKIEIPII